MIWGLRQYDAGGYEASMKHVSQRLTLLDKHLEGREWLVGNHVTLADIIVFCKKAEILLEMLAKFNPYRFKKNRQFLQCCHNDFHKEIRLEISKFPKLV